ncbi:molybdopterin-dependent oxidoreductase [Tardiphaga sp. vice304]|uniref:xanthine dehydrogenase family protein molybdopterin-binding subunit n=1 Tax=unclassified Tardiphaga TaxID=2631404 RepID=UPI001165115B|nr:MULTISPECIES: molybdopterin cofactor-binding domain-containing protein [unclassified Tardiphaga]QDM16033.1 molybdopterin-dependent oxidoreductase [Tardiphaga sp. vice278]QDM21131.1 molybdopterin-dependent oxidoreductase [Tardiphaga sp. vice154]QDM26240.1 molybdopterin-dependent oxidoreductase [Tardiphaga sp. vice304]
MTKLPANLALNPRLGRWVSIDGSDFITIRTGKVELGQGAVTAIAAIAAKELGVDLARIRMQPADTDTSPDEGYTAGSFSVEHGGAAMRWVCAMVRELFAQRAQTVLGEGDIVVQAGVFTRAQSNEGVSYWALAADVDLDQSTADLPEPRMLGGTIDAGHLQRLDLDRKLTGAAFIQDMALPGMHYGRVMRGAHPRDRLVSFDIDKVATLPGVVAVVVDGSFMGVVARRDEQALRAIDVAGRTAQWQRDAELPETADTHAWIAALTPRSTTFLADEGPEPVAQHRHHAAYSRGFIAHASIGPSCAIAAWDADQVTVWSHSQGIHPLRGALARALHLKNDSVRVIHAQGAGCYGHNGADDVALDAALLARTAKVPVMCQWTRADELSWSPFGAAMRVELDGAVDANGQIVEWRHAVWSPPHLARPGFGDGVNLLAAQQIDPPHPPGPPSEAPRPYGGGDRNAVPLYNLGKRSITHHLLPQGPLRSSALRSLGAHCNVFAIESFMDELAALAGIDPVEFRLRHLDEPRAEAVIRAAAELAQWDPADKGGEGIGRGIGFSRYKNHGAYYAAVATVEITDVITIKDVYGALDAGEIIHRDGTLNQIEGGVIQAASWTLKEQVSWTSDGFAVRAWDDYPILKFSEIPRIQTTIIERPGEFALGAGECAAGPVAAAIGNAIAHALGVRGRDMPLTFDRLEAAINAQ